MPQAEQILTLDSRPQPGVTASGLPLPADLTDFQRDYLIKLDARALKAGERIKAAHPSPAQLRLRAAEYRARGLEWLAGINSQLADDLGLDPRLAALGPLTAASCGDGGFGKMFIPLYRDILIAHLAATEAA